MFAIIGYVSLSCFTFFILLNKERNDNLYFVTSLFYFVYFFLLFVLRQSAVGADYVGYLELYDTISNSSYIDLQQLRYETLFIYTIKILSYFFDAKTGFLVLNFVLLVCLCVSMLLLHKSLYTLLFFLFICSSYFVFYNLNLNILRQGLSISFFLLSIALFVSDRYKSGFIFMFLSCGFHNSAYIYIPVFVFSLFCAKKKHINTLYALMLLFIISSYFRLNEYVLQNISIFSNDDYYSMYILGKDDYQSGFRIDFILFSIVPLLVSSFLMRWVDDSTRDRINTLLCFSIISFFIFINFDFIAYSDRLLVYTWMMNVVIISIIMTHQFNNNIIRLFSLLVIFGFGIYSFITNPVMNIITILD